MEKSRFKLLELCAFEVYIYGHGRVWVSSFKVLTSGAVIVARVNVRYKRDIEPLILISYEVARKDMQFVIKQNVRI